MNAAGQAEPRFPVESIEAHLRTGIHWPGAPHALVQAAEYALLAGGKRLRPALAWFCAEAVGGMGEESLPAGVAVEMVHAFSLVHDDLPAIDNDDMRRGRPTLHKHAGEAMAILAGDALLAGAFDCVLRLPLNQAYRSRMEGASLADYLLSGAAGVGEHLQRHDDADSLLRAELLRELAGASSAMIQGQVWDTMGGLPQGLTPHDELRLIHSRKTGALLAAACRMGALSALGPFRTAAQQAALAAIDTFGTEIGLMFQIVDDLIDATQPSEHAGKKTGKDAAAGKRTYPSALGIDASHAEVERLRHAALAAIAPFGDKAENLRQLTDYLSRRTK